MAVIQPRGIERVFFLFSFNFYAKLKVWEPKVHLHQSNFPLTWLYKEAL